MLRRERVRDREVATLFEAGEIGRRRRVRKVLRRESSEPESSQRKALRRIRPLDGRPHETSHEPALPSPPGSIAAVSRSRLWLLAGWTALLALAGSIYLGPYIATWRIREAVVAGDHETLARLVDFSAIREDLKGELRRRAGAEQRARERDDNGNGSGVDAGGSLRERLAVAVGEAMIDRMATPEALGEAIGPASRDGGSREGGTGRDGTDIASFLAFFGEEGAGDAIRVKADYDGWSDFRVRLTARAPGVGDAPLWADILLERRGIWFWQVTGARLSPDAIPALTR